MSDVHPTRQQGGWFKIECVCLSQIWESKELIETRKFEITNRRNKKSFQPKELRSVDEEMQISNFPSKLQCFNKLFHQTRHISDYVTSLSFSLPQIESRRLLTLWHHSDWRFLLLLQSTSILTCNDVRHGYHCLSIYGFNSARALIFSARQLVWVLSKSQQLVGESNGKDGQSSTIFSITERKTILRILLQYERRREQ